jgi:predicted phosphoribosyltransferase
MMFDDRTAAGERLAAELDRRGTTADIVLGIPRGALPVARPVADALDAALDVVVARKMGAPGNPELAIGAVASDGSVWRNEALIEQLGVSEDYVESTRDEERENARQKADRYRSTPSGPDLADKRVVVVDDGVATGATARACLGQVHAADAGYVALAVPVCSPRTLEELESEADDIVALHTPADFRAVGQYYRDFGQVSDAEAVTYLEK